MKLISCRVQLGNIQTVQLHVCMTLCHVFHLDLFSVTGAVFSDTRDCLVTRLVIQVCSLTKWKLRNRFFQKKRRDWQKIKQRCHRYRVSNVCCKLQMAAFQFPDGNSTFYSWRMVYFNKFREVVDFKWLKNNCSKFSNNDSNPSRGTRAFSIQQTKGTVSFLFF